jgi:FKBP-type peptidyl-prolyl cis-trans isomerase FkpA
MATKILPLSLLLSLLAALPATGCKRLSSGKSSSADLKTDDEKTIYALGLDIGRNIEAFSLTKAELELVKAGLDDAVNKRTPKIELDANRPKIFQLLRQRQEAKAVTEKQRGKDLVEKAGKESGAERLPSGIVVKTVRAGTGASPTADDTVKVNYEGRLIDGKVFDSSYKRNQPAEFPLRGVVKCWTEGVQKMKVGGKAQLTCPYDTAYGDQGSPPTIPGGATLTFDIELLEIVKKP